MQSMLTELKRCNSIGDISGVLFLISVLTNKEKVSKREIAGRCALENGITINCTGAIAFLEYLGYVTSDMEMVYPHENFVELLQKDDDATIQVVVKKCISQMIEEGIFDADATCFDAETGHLSIKRSAFPLAYAAIRNFLTVAGVLDKEQSGGIAIRESYESEFSAVLRDRKQKFTLEDLIKRQEEQNRRGLEAEEFVLAYERNLLPGKAKQIKRISDFDVSAGYDIVSYNNEQSIAYDKLIEVKCYLGNPHFYWSENEVDVAMRKGDKYYLCLVDYNMIGTDGYTPFYIRNPYEVIFKSESWLVETASYKVTKI